MSPERRLTPEETATKLANTDAKVAARNLDIIRDSLRALGQRRNGVEIEAKTVADTVADLVPKGAAAGITYEELAALTGLSRARIGQILAEHKKTNPTPTAPAARPTRQPDTGLVAPVAEL